MNSVTYEVDEFNEVPLDAYVCILCTMLYELFLYDYLTLIGILMLNENEFLW